MWDFKSFPKEQDILAKFGKYSTITGVLMSILGK